VSTVRLAARGLGPGGERGSLSGAMTVLACLTHWYTSAMFVVPVLAVGGWGWWNSRRVGRHQMPSPHS
jgi:hypothetical protein